MKHHYTFSKYILKSFSLWFSIVLSSFSVIILLFTLLELLRKNQSYNQVKFLKILAISFLRLPGILDQLFPFLILFSTMLMLWHLHRRSELIVVRAAGFSIWGILSPIIVFISIYSLLYLIVLNPLISSTEAASEQLSNKLLGKPKNLLSLSKGGIWLKDSHDDDYSILHGESISNDSKTLDKVTIYNFDDKGNFISRLDSPQVQIQSGKWILKSPFLSESNDLMRPIGDQPWKTDLTLEKLQKSFDPPASISVWKLPNFIRLMENAGFSGTEHRLYLYTLITKPFLLISMLFLGGIVAFSTLRQRNSFFFVSTGISLGFLLYLLHHILHILGSSLTIPLLVSALIPTIVVVLASLALLIHLEEG
jgi:lipopolysaccharide export system permease protein